MTVAATADQVVDIVERALQIRPFWDTAVEFVKALVHIGVFPSRGSISIGLSIPKCFAGRR